MSKFEQLLDLLVNEEHEKANELFHEIVVEKSREIYENIIAEEASQEMDEDADENEDDNQEDESVEEAFGMEDEGEADGEMGGDATDDFVSDTESPDDEFGGEEGGEEGGDESPATKADVQDLEDALEELKAEFERLMNAEEAEEEENPGVHGDASLTGGDEGEESDDAEDSEKDGEEDEFESLYNESRQLTREYREKVGNDWDKNAQKTDGQIAGANSGEKMPTASSGKSPVSSGAGKPTSGASAKNIAQGGMGVGNNTGTTPNAKGPAGVLKAGGDFVPAGTKNVSSSSTSKMTNGAALNKQGSGYPGNNKSAGPVGSGTGDKAGQTSVGSQKSVVDHKQP